MNTTEKTTLLHILGHIDGALEPQSLDGTHWQADRQSLASYADTGCLLIASAGENSNAKLRHRRAVESLTRAGLLVAAGKLIGLTPQGHTEARKLADLPGMDNALDLLAAIAGHPDRWSCGGVSESSLLGGPPLPPGRIGCERIPIGKASLLAYTVAPLLVARLVSWRGVAGLDGVFLFKPTDRGREQAKRGKSESWFKRCHKPKGFTPPPPWCDAWQSAFQSRQHATPERPCMVHHLDPTDPPEGAE
jgi:hypothetical protein